MPFLSLPGLPSLHGIIEAIANGFFGALAHALVPSFLSHAGVATIQALVALPDPAAWPHVSQLQGEMTWLGVLLLPVTLTVGALRYWLVGLTGGAHPVSAVGRAGWASGVLVAYRWLVEQVVAGANTLTHAILGFPAVGGGLSRIVGVLFGGSLLVGAGGVFGAFLVILGVVFAAGLFAAQVLVTLVLALLTVAGPPLIAVSAIPELSHLARSWAHALLAVALVPVGWTVLFATAGALALDASSFTGDAGGLPEHVAAAFAALITFVLALRLPIVLFAHARRLMFTSAAGAQAAPPLPGSERVRAAHARLRALAFTCAPAFGGAMGAAAGAFGAPAGGPLGAARRRLRAATHGTAPRDPDREAGASAPRPVRSRAREALTLLREAPGRARAAIATSQAAGPTRAPSRPPAAGGAAWRARPPARRAHRPGVSSSTRAGHVRVSHPAAADAVTLPARTRPRRPGKERAAADRRDPRVVPARPAGGGSPRPRSAPSAAVPPASPPRRARRKPRPGAGR